MRALRLTLAGTVAVALLGAAAIGALAQSGDDELPVPASVVITSVFDSEEGLGAVVEPGADYAVVDGYRGLFTWDATDPRLSGTATYTGRFHRYPKLHGVELTAGIWTVTNEDGAWRGQSRGLHSPNATHGDTAMAVLTGDGAYDGLTANLTWDEPVDVPKESTIRGVIIADELPPFPEADE